MTRKAPILAGLSAVVLAALLALTALPARAGGWKWIAYGDTRTNDAYHRAVLASMKANTPDYKFIINVGDVTENGTDVILWNIWQSACNDNLGGTGQNNVPPSYMSVIGNHENIGTYDGLKNWNTYLPGQAQQFGNSGKMFFFDYQDARFILLNSEDPYTGPNKTLLLQALQTNTKKWLFAIWHKPIFDFGVKAYEPSIHQEWGIPLYQNGCDIMFMGHAHYYVRSKKLRLEGSMNPPLDSLWGTVQLVTGNGGAPQAAVDENHDGNGYMVAYSYDQNVAPFFGYTELNVDGDTLRLRHISTTGQVMDQTVYTANPKPGVTPRYPLQLVTIGQGSIDSFPADTTYYEHTQVRLRATPRLGWRFTGWQGGGLAGDAKEAWVRIDSALQITAHFEKLPDGQFELRPNPVPVGTIELTPPGSYYARGTEVVARAVAPLGWRLTGWSDAATGTSDTIRVVADTNKLLTAIFHPMQINMLRLRPSGDGLILASPAGAQFAETTSVSLTVQPGQGSQFLEWTGGVNGTAGSVTVSMQSPQEIKARFSRIGAQRVTVSPSADGYVRGSVYASSNYGADSVLRVLEGTSDLYRFRSYLSFPLRGLSGTVRTATLRMNANRAGFPDGIPARVMACSATGPWTEAGLTWKTAPVEGALADSVTFMAAPGNVYSWNLTGPAAQALAAGDTALTVLLKDLPGNPRTVIFDARQTAHPPVLEIELENPDAVGETVPPAVPRENRLEQNYPNPFNPSTVVRYLLRAPSMVSLEVFDVLGRKVSTLAGGVQAAGAHEAVWTPEGFASGIYYCRLSALPLAGGVHQPFTATRTMILMR